MADLNMLEHARARTRGLPVEVTDAIDVVQQLGLHQPFCFGHSLGGVVALAAEALHPGLWKSVCVFEPPITVTEEQVCVVRWCDNMNHMCCPEGVPCTRVHAGNATDILETAYAWLRQL